MSRSGMRRDLILAASAVVVTVAIVAAFLLIHPGRTGTPPSHTIAGKVRVITSTGCGKGGFSDIDQGAGVTVKNEAGTVIGSATLGPVAESGPYSVICDYGFTVANVPEARFYGIEVGRRSALQYSIDEMNQKGWQVSISLSSR